MNQYQFAYEIVCKSGMSVGSTLLPDLESAKRAMLTELVYQESEAHNVVTEYHLMRLCATCDGRGHIGEYKGKRVRRYVTKKCPDCKGKNFCINLI